MGATQNFQSSVIGQHLDEEPPTRQLLVIQRLTPSGQLWLLDRIYFSIKVNTVTSPRSKRRIFVTGGSSGIGLAVANAFSKAGHDVIVSGRTKQTLKQSGFEFVEMDVTDEQSVIDGVKTAGDIDIFIANAGAAGTAPALKTSRELWDQMLAVNLTSVYLCAREAIPQMVERKWGRFIAIASTASLKGYAYTGAYAAAKHGVVGWIKTLALELATNRRDSERHLPRIYRYAIGR